MKKIIQLTSLTIICFAFYFLYSHQLTIDKKITTLEQDVQNLNSQLNKKDDYSYMDTIGNIEKYGAGVLQIGGIGSRFNQPSAYLVTEHGYLKPTEEWVNVSFNGPADMMDVSCRDGYKVTSCQSNGRLGDIDTVLGCRTTLENKMQNIVGIECSKN